MPVHAAAKYWQDDSNQYARGHHDNSCSGWPPAETRQGKLWTLFLLEKALTWQRLSERKRQAGQDLGGKGGRESSRYFDVDLIKRETFAQVQAMLAVMFSLLKYVRRKARSIDLRQAICKRLSQILQISMYRCSYKSSSFATPC